MEWKNPYDIFLEECPELAERFDRLVEVQRTLKGLDRKTKELISIAIMTALRNPDGVRMHAILAHRAGATRDEITGAVVMNLHLTGLVSVLDCLPAALEGISAAAREKEKKRA